MNQHKTSSTTKLCPNCGASLPAEATFCPHCAKSINTRKTVKPPRHVPRKMLRLFLWLLLAALLCGGVYLATKPQKIDGLGEVNYTDKDGSYQLLVNVSSDRYKQMTESRQTAGDEERYRFPLRLYINHKDSGADSGGIFLQKVQSTEIEVEQADGSKRPVTATEPQADATFPDAAQVSYIDFSRESPEQAQLIWKLHMKNGDLLRIRFNLFITPTKTYNFNTDNADLSDAASLQALIDRLAEDPSINSEDTINIYLPPVTYKEPIVLRGRSFNLYGTEKDGQRSTFAAGIQQLFSEKTQGITYLTDLDFTGDGSGVALSTANRSWMKNCRFTNWKTAILSFGRSWVNTTNCTFTGNGIGLYYNSADGSPADTRFTENTFTDNQTAVLLEEVPSDIKMDFTDSKFQNNDTDIDNRCNQPLELSKAVFQ